MTMQLLSRVICISCRMGQLAMELDSIIMRYKYDTVENNQENLLAVSGHYEQGADILLQHQGFCGIKGKDKDNQQYKIPCHYSFENRGFEVDFVIANSEATAKAAGKRVEQERRADNAVNAHLCRAMTLDDAQLAAATAVMRGNVTIRDDDSYVSANLGQWHNETDDDLRDEICRVCDISADQAEKVCWSFTGY